MPNEKVKKLINAANELAKEVIFKDAENKIEENPFDVVGDTSILDESAEEVKKLLEVSLSDEEVEQIVANIDGDTHDHQEVVEWANVSLHILSLARNKFLSV